MYIKGRMSAGHSYSVIVKGEKCSEAYSLKFMENLFREEGKGFFDVRTCTLGLLCQGSIPSPLDRVRGSVLGAKAVQTLINHTSDDKPQVTNYIYIHIYIYILCMNNSITYKYIYSVICI